MNAEIITIGDELLIGQTLDTNSVWMGNELGKIGIQVSQKTAISDQKHAIFNALNESRDRTNIILVTGGLGPTKDDITKKALCDYFKSRLIRNKSVYENVKNLFEAKGYSAPEVNWLQADVPHNCEVLMNYRGTAPGMWFEIDGKVVVSMPGVPYEMKGIMLDYVLPRLQKKFQTEHIVHRTVLTQGIGESFLMEIIGEWEQDLERNNIRLAYLPSLGNVKLRLTLSSKNIDEIKVMLDDKITRLKTLIPKYFLGEEGSALEQIVGRLLLEKGATISAAESCTGGYVSHLLTSLSGSSEYFKGSIISYSNEIKIQQLGVAEGDLHAYGAVSREVVSKMATGVRQLLKTDYAIATSGIAGPTGGTAEKPIGTIWMAVATPTNVFAEMKVFGNPRISNIKEGAMAALNLVRNELIKKT